ncbi:LemA family protein [candidate division WWE3 bacterium]|nr:LemA family protein [candidate division WWE3 bacterium]
MQITTILFVLVICLAFYFLYVYNTLATMKVRIKEAWSQIDVQLKRRIDLIPNIVESVKGYAAHEKEVFENVTKARAALMGATGVEATGKADNMLSGALKSLFAVAEAYPELKAQEGFINLQKELSDTEDKVSYSRQFFNTVVRDYNTMLVTFPNSFVANMFGFSDEKFFEAEEVSKVAPKVTF